MPIRSVVVKDDRRMILISPIRFDDAQIARLRGIGEVTDIVAPCLFHHLSIPHAMKLFPKATVWGVPGFEKKRPDIAWTKTLTPETWIHGDLLKVFPIDGTPAMNEIVFLHEDSGTLIATDLIFNLRRPEGWSAPLLLRLLGTYDGFAISRLLHLATKDRAALKTSLARVAALDFERIIMGHGEVVESGGKRMLLEAMWLRGLAEKEGT